MARKKKYSFFGNNIEPSCSYCRNYISSEENECAMHLSIGLDGKCKAFDYDPLMREPLLEKKLDITDFTLEDFKL